MINLTFKIPKGEGVQGAYYKLSHSRGVKTIGNEHFISIQDVRESYEYKATIRECANYRFAFKSGIVPKCYGVTIVKTLHGYKPALILQDLGTIRLGDMTDDYSKLIEVENNLAAILLNHGVSHRDLHSQNIMYFEGKYWAIDFHWAELSNGTPIEEPVPITKGRSKPYVKEVSMWLKVLRYFKLVRK